MLRAYGSVVVVVDVFWNLHERERGVYDFSGRKNITRFYELAAQMGIFLHVRFGPYVCAEWNNGGLPVWLNWIPDMKVRSNNGPWKAEMERFLRYMVDVARPFMASNGGPIILAQIENEFTAEDPGYIEWCGTLVQDLNTSIPWVMYVLRCILELRRTPEQGTHRSVSSSNDAGAMANPRRTRF